MIPKIIHNIWIQGYDNLPNEHKITYMNLKKMNPEWDFMIWDNEMIKGLLKKYPTIYELYNKNTYNAYEKDSIKSDIARYIIVKEYGGLYFDIEYTCNSSINEIFTNEQTKNNTKNTIYIATSKIDLLDYFYPFQKPEYSSCFMAMDKNHPIWNKVLEKLQFANTKYQIQNALDIALQENKRETNPYPIVLFDKVNGYYQCANKDTVCFIPISSGWNLARPILKYINCYYKQIILFIIAIIIIIFVELLYMHNAVKYGAVNFIPGIPGSAPPSHPILQKKKGKPKGKTKG
jgi:hypothetical protein